jgi:hypothetical protein
MSCFFLLILLGNLPLSTKAVGQQSTQSDVAAVQALRNVVLQSGGEAAWGGLTSSKEFFSMVSPSDPTPKTTAFLDDWSLPTTRYRRKTNGQKAPPVDHNGTSTFSVRINGGWKGAPELDQPRALMSHLPVVAAQILLRDPQYVLKLSKSEMCAADMVCVEVYRMAGSMFLPHPEELWTISSATGLPVRVRYRTPTVIPGETWSQASFLKYSQEGDLILPTSIVTSLAGPQQAWTFVSLQKNPGFDTAAFDNEVGK